MCGIAGFFGRGTLDDLAGMVRSMYLRGPDDSGFFQDSEQAVFLGHRRLSILDVAGGHQPMSHKDGTLHVVFNGEIYNHHELRKTLTLRGHTFYSDHSDTEVLLHGYREWGDDLPTRLNGMFAFAIFDASAGRILLARDRFGEKPLYYHLTDKRELIFASELKALLKHSSCNKTISKKAMKKFFAYGFIPAPDTIIDNVFKLNPGCQLSYDISHRSLSVKQYWNFKLTNFDEKTYNFSDIKTELRRLVDQAVERRLMSDVPLGVFLSGGIDSSIVLSAVVKQRSPSSVDTFSIGFREASFDESVYAREVADFFGTRHHERILDATSALDILESVLDQIDEPLGDPSLLPTYLLAKFAREHVKVALGGDGADELFAGYDPFKALKLASYYHQIVPKSLHNVLKSAVRRLGTSDRNMSLGFRLGRTLRGLSYQPEIWNPVWLGPVDAAELSHLFSEPTNLLDTYQDTLEDWSTSSEYSLTEHCLSFYTKLYLPNNILTKLDRASMLASLEGRSPFLDNDLVDFARTLPTRLKLHKGTTKYLLKETYKDILPHSVTHRPKKGFGIPLSAWLRTWGDSSFINNLPHVNQAWLKSRWDEHMNRTADHRQLLWCAISLSRFINAI
jgi:asparagine synthase (glutamine-hydrolysing)